MPCRNYGRIEWQRTLAILEMTLDAAYQDILNEFDLTLGEGGGLKGLIVTRSNLGVTWKVRPKHALFFYFPPGCVGSPEVVVFWFPSCN